MQLDEARQIRKAWGKRPCSHPDTEKEYHLGCSTGDYVCTTCGEARPSSHWHLDATEKSDKDKSRV